MLKKNLKKSNVLFIQRAITLRSYFIKDISRVVFLILIVIYFNHEWFLTLIYLIS